MIKVSTFSQYGPQKAVLSNAQIQFVKVRLLDELNAYVADVSSSDALRLARSKSLDLILVSATSVPPLCKIGCLAQHTQPSSLCTSVGFDPGRPPKFVHMDIKEDAASFERKIGHARRLLTEGYQTNVFIKRKSTDSLSLIVERFQLVIIRLKDIAIALNAPKKTSELRCQLVLQLDFKPIIEHRMSFIGAGVRPLLYDDLPVTPERLVQPKDRLSFGRHRWRGVSLIEDDD